MNRTQVETILGFLRSPLIAATKTAAAFVVGAFLVWLAHFGVRIPDGTAGALVALIVAIVATGWTFVSNVIVKRFPASSKLLGPAAAYHPRGRDERGAVDLLGFLIVLTFVGVVLLLAGVHFR